jgi:4-diphosphocytidyl-2-C-methyl-D-erythritol kinase
MEPLPQVRLRSLAKINLDLRVLGKRPDGFHELRSIFQTVSLADTILIDYTPARRSCIQIESAIDIPDNLIAKAAELILAAMKQQAQIQFRLDKRIPMGGGLGGGSSNAAAVLLALPVLAQKQVPLEMLLEIAAQLGSDVPFFLLGGTAAGLGRGTEIYPLPDSPSKPALLVCPPIHVSTAAAYQGLNRELTHLVPLRIMNSFQSFAWSVGDRGPGETWDSVNDFESVVFSQHPQLKSIKGKLLTLGARPALMSGSGSTIFGLFDSRLERDRAGDWLRASSLGKELGSENIHPVSLVNRRQYRSLWWRQLRLEVERNVWPPRSRYAK